jgi:hypothetical protein
MQRMTEAQFLQAMVDSISTVRGEQNRTAIRKLMELFLGYLNEYYVKDIM